MRLLPPSPNSQGLDHSSSSQFSAENRARSFTMPSADATARLRHNPAIGSTSRDASLGASSSFDPANYISPINRPPTSRLNSNMYGSLPSYSEILPTGDASEHHTHASSEDLDHPVLPSIREVLGPEMHLVEERRRTDGS
jgi:hypothetical protein